MSESGAVFMHIGLLDYCNASTFYLGMILTVVQAAELSAGARWHVG